MKTITLRRVVVTGLGAVTDLGTDVASTWEGMLSGRSGVGPITAFEQDDEWTTRFAGEVSDFDPSKIVDVREAKRMDRASLLGLVAAEEAANDCGIDFATGDPDRRGVAIGSGIGGIITIEVGLLKLERTSPKKISPFTVPKLMVNACAGNVSIRHGLRGANIATATACATGGHSIGAAFQLIQRGDADVMFAGGTEAAVSRLCIGSFGTMKALSTRNDDPQRASRPFDRDRDGFVLAEGAAVLILEDLESAKARGAKIYGEILGYATSGDAHHIAAPEESGIGATKAMTWALKDAGINTTDVGYINAHGTSTPLGDAAEVYAVKSVFGEHAADLAMSSTKSMTGHALGAAGGIESVAVIRALQEGILPPTINLENPDDGFDLDFVANEAREKPIQYAVNNSFGFGGHNVSLVFSRYNGD
ncbi:MAG: beta-ketoacyl-ACP synthase II [Phycisphaeraceae bacterium]|nr:beta-ketoacyl-[acyl-carrier-protein] synthase II [Phycisphaerae bacterium]MCP4012698.1 beta-ketoacyl-ACP synthase II [Phycisphaeraceae bacterium]MDG1361597.1 beta-ketoacyl-ACP synthase II [Phycisphaerales bacterium]MCP4796163.1 beta-ketoacyl-ACP synthase II [Phycisphaeraceae bacterium]MCP4938529.1 beta-ketoacyl-ACP synthase II [Phycisphaeraceae bacterium]